jgi:hypothetical protein
VAGQLAALSDAAATLEAAEPLVDAHSESVDDDWVILILPDEPAIFMSPTVTQEVVVTGFRFTPKGMMYELRHRTHTVTWRVPAESVQPVHGETRLMRYNLMTGEQVEL